MKLLRLRKCLPLAFGILVLSLNKRPSTPVASAPVKNSSSKPTQPTTDRSTIASLPRPIDGTPGCGTYDGVLLISLAPKLAAAGTVFFQSVVNQLLYAERHNLKPWIHFDKLLKHIYDPGQHGNSSVIVDVQEGMMVSTTNESYPGRPVLMRSNLTRATRTIAGSSIWSDYFEPVSDYPASKCAHPPALIEMTLQDIKPGFHQYCPYAVRSWRYSDLPPEMLKSDLTLKEWYEPMRIRASDVVKRYFRFLPYIQQEAEQALGDSAGNCLAMHVRHSDKGAARRIVTMDEFLPYVQAYYNAGGRHVYIATDSQIALQEVQSTNWTTHLSGMTFHSQSNIIRSTGKTAVFWLTSSHHRTNIEVLVDILAASRCSYMLHGRSAVSEAAIYLNLALHNRSVDLEDPDRYMVADFEQLIRSDALHGS